MTRASAGNIYGTAFLTVRNLIIDNATIASGTFAAFPQETNITYPLYTIEAATSDTDWKSFGASSRGVMLNFEISCFSTNLRQVDELADEAEKILTQNQSATNKSGLGALEINSTGIAHDEVNNKLVHAKTLNASYKWAGDIQ